MYTWDIYHYLPAWMVGFYGIGSMGRKAIFADGEKWLIFMGSISR